MTVRESKGQKYAIKCHRDANHLYDGRPYEVHLQMVVDEFNQFKHLIPESQWPIVEGACWCHDVIEDCRQTYNDVKKATRTEVADIVYALTNEKGNPERRGQMKNIIRESEQLLGLHLSSYVTELQITDIPFKPNQKWLKCMKGKCLNLSVSCLCGTMKKCLIT